MRKGENVSKDILLSGLNSDHRIIIPLYIPNEEDYYKDAFMIFTYCLISIKKTSLTNIKISVVSNGSCDAVNTRLLQMQQDNFIDELIIERENIGKINSILKALRTAQERLITITDGDVLFCNNWEDAITEIFESFPNAGAVSPVPVFRKQLNMTSNVWFKYFFSKKLYFRSVKNPAAMEKFAQSLGWFSLEDRFKDLICTLKAKNGTLAVLGCSHFVATYKREVFDTIPQINSLYKLGGDSEQLYLDLPVIKMGGYRLSTHDNFAFHLGNHLEPWMEEKFNELSESIKIEKQYSNFKKLTKSPSNFWLTEKVFKQLFYNQKFYNYVLRLKGISKEKIETFWY